MALNPEARGVALPASADATVVRGQTITGQPITLYMEGYQSPGDAPTARRLSEQFLDLGDQFPPGSVGEDVALRRALTYDAASQVLPERAPRKFIPATPPTQGR